MSPDRPIALIAEIVPLQEPQKDIIKTAGILQPPAFSLRQRLVDVLNVPGRKEYRRRGRGSRGLSHRSAGRCSQCAGIGSERPSFCRHRLFRTNINNLHNIDKFRFNLKHLISF